jgi:tripartite-type tricarboxylate transporter receptor subunit TctC
MNRFLRSLACLLVLTVTAGAASAQTYPERSIASIGPFAAGGGTDLLLRAIADGLSKKFGHAVMHTVRAGANGTLAGSAIASAEPDGYTYGALVHPGAVPEVYKYFTEATYKSDDLVPVARICVFPAAIFVRADSPLKTVADLIAMAKDPAAPVSVAHVGRGHLYHLVLSAIAKKNGVEIRDVPTTGGAEVLKEVLGGHIVAGMAATGSGGRKFVEAGELRMLAVLHTERLPWAPDVPTLAESNNAFGFQPLYEWIFVPKGTPPERVEALTAAIKEVLGSEELQATAKKLDIIVSFGDPEQVRADMTADTQAVTAILPELGMWKP